MEALFTWTSLHDILDSLDIRTPRQQINLWTVQKTTRRAVQQLVISFGKLITKAHAGQLTKLGITKEILDQWKERAKDVHDFANILRREKVNSKKLQDNLCLFYFNTV